MKSSKCKRALTGLALIAIGTLIIFGSFLTSAAQLVLENISAGPKAVIWNWCPSGVTEISIDLGKSSLVQVTSAEEIKKLCAARILDKIEASTDLDFKLILSAKNPEGLKTFVERTSTGIYRVDGMLFRSADFEYKLNKLTLQRSLHLR